MDTAYAFLVRHQNGRTKAKAAGTLTSDRHAGGFVGGLDGIFGLAMPAATVRAAIRCPWKWLALYAELMSSVKLIQAREAAKLVQSEAFVFSTEACYVCNIFSLSLADL